MKKLTAIIVTVFISMLMMSSAFGAASVTLSKTKVNPGSSVTVSGVAEPDTGIVVKATDGDGNIVFFEAVNTDASGNYSVLFKVPGNATGTLTITAGSGSDVASAGMTVSKPPSPTAKPKSTPTPSPQATPAASPSPSASPGAGTADATATPSPSPSVSPTVSPAASPSEDTSPSPAAPETSPTPTPGEKVIIRPAAVEEDEQTGTVTIRIHVSDLPQGTYAVQTPGGDTVYVGDSEDGVLTIEASQEDIGRDGAIELITVDEAMAPAGAVHVQAQHKSGGGVWKVLAWVAGGLVLLCAGAYVIYILKKRQQ